MLLYRVSATALALETAAGADTLVQRLSESFRFAYGAAASASECRAWARSLPVLAQDLSSAGLGQVEVLIEYQLPQTSKRADVVLCGTHPRSGRPSFVVVELKQWTQASMVDAAPDLCRVPGLGDRLHPVDQVRRYTEYLRDFVKALDANAGELAGAAYLHNMTTGGAQWLADRVKDNDGRLFTAASRDEFQAFLRSRLSPATGAGAADTLLRSAVGPSKKLLDLAAAEIREQEQFILLDEQQVAFSLVVRAVHRAREANSKQIVIVTGGPGSGKSVIALALLGDLSRIGYSVLHATGSRAFTLTLRKVAGSRAPRVQSMFKYFNNFIDARKNGLDVLVCDEAHRIRETSANRYTRAQLRTGRSQTEELIDAARVPVFLLDEHQVVRPGEIGTVHEIESVAQRLGIEVVRVDLDGQFRAGGSALYDTWVRRLLGLEPGGPLPWNHDDDRYSVRVADSPSALEQALGQRLAQGLGARMTAGFCWDWSDAQEDRLIDDVRIGEWHRPWNVKGERRVGDAPPSQLWATDPKGFSQVGCIYTAQGFEYDWNGVIFGPDLVWRAGAWVARPEASADTVVARRATAEEFDRLIRHVYKVLLTRGMVGTILYSTDRETQEFLASLV
jgi:hypothetical protein